MGRARPRRALSKMERDRAEWSGQLGSPGWEHKGQCGRPEGVGAPGR